MKTRAFTLTLVILLGLSLPLLAQTPFEIYAFTYRHGPKSLEYFKNNNVTMANLLTQGAIIDPLNPKNDTTVSPAAVRKYLVQTYPDVAANGTLVINWESKVFKHLRDYPVTDSRFKYAEGQWRALVQEVRKTRPRLKIGIYAISFRVWGTWQKINYNPAGKYDNLLSLLDFITPSVYMQFADEEVGHERNLEYIKDNLDIALTYGKRLNKPVYPFIWHRVHSSNETYPRALIQIQVLADYVRFISSYSLNNYKSSGICLWEVVGQRDNPGTLSGINGWLNGTVYDADTYDMLIVKYVTAMKKAVQ